MAWVPPSAVVIHSVCPVVAPGSHSPQLLAPGCTGLQCWPVVTGFTFGQWGWGFPVTALGGAWMWCPFFWVLNFGSHLPLCLSACLGLWMWAFDRLIAPAVGLDADKARILSGLFHLPSSFCAPLWMCRWSFITQFNVNKLVHNGNVTAVLPYWPLLATLASSNPTTSAS